MESFDDFLDRLIEYLNNAGVSVYVKDRVLYAAEIDDGTSKHHG